MILYHQGTSRLELHHAMSTLSDGNRQTLDRISVMLTRDPKNPAAAPRTTPPPASSVLTTPLPVSEYQPSTPTTPPARRSDVAAERHTPPGRSRNHPNSVSPEGQWGGGSPWSVSAVDNQERARVLHLLSSLVFKEVHPVYNGPPLVQAAPCIPTCIVPDSPMNRLFPAPLKSPKDVPEPVPASLQENYQNWINQRIEEVMNRDDPVNQESDSLSMKEPSTTPSSPSNKLSPSTSFSSIESDTEEKPSDEEVRVRRSQTTIAPTSQPRRNETAESAPIVTTKKDAKSVKLDFSPFNCNHVSGGSLCSAYPYLFCVFIQGAVVPKTRFVEVRPILGIVFEDRRSSVIYSVRCSRDRVQKYERDL